MPPASACTSSMITVSTPRRLSLAREVSSRNSDSGVVIRMSGGLLASCLRSSAAVSPVLTPTRICGSGSSRRRIAWLTPASGERRFRSMSTASALSGEMYSTRQRCAGSAGGGSVASLSIAHRNAASVLPDPVGAMTSAFSPLPIALHACAWAVVGSAKAARNQDAVGSEKPASAPVAAPESCSGAARAGIPPYCRDIPTARDDPCPQTPMARGRPAAGTARHRASGQTCLNPAGIGWCSMARLAAFGASQRKSIWKLK